MTDSTEVRKCENCDYPLPKRKDGRYHKSRRYCSPACASEASHKSYIENNPSSGLLSAPTIGAISEIMVAVDLMQKGYSVFRAMSPSCACDLAVLRYEKLLRIEVITGTRSPSGGLMNNKRDSSKFDILAVVLPGPGEIYYTPEMPSILDKSKRTKRPKGTAVLYAPPGARSRGPDPVAGN